MASTSPPFAAFSAHRAACVRSRAEVGISKIILGAGIARFRLLQILAAYLIRAGERGYKE
jgi:hypothetical protein